MFRILFQFGLPSMLVLVSLNLVLANDEQVLANVAIPEEAKEVDVGYRRLGNVTQKFEYRLNGELVGERLFYKNGKLAEEKIYRDEKLHGYWRQYYENGQLFAERPYRQGKPDGVFRFYNENGKILGESMLKDGTGTLREFPCAQLASDDAVIPYRDGIIQGSVRTWGRYGRPRRTGLQEDKVDGVHISQYRDNQLNGWGNTYDSQGKLFLSAYSKDGVLHGVFRRYDAEGRLAGGWPKYYIRNQEVSRTAYIRAAEDDPVLKISLEKDRPDEKPDLKRPE